MSGAERLVATLVSDPARLPLGEPHLLRAREALEAAGCKLTRSFWLAEAEALDLECVSPAPPQDVRHAISARLEDMPIDVICQPAASRRKALLISDMDSTIITIECIDELAAVAGIKPKVAEITERAMRGELDFKAALKERVALLEGLPESAMEEVYRHALRFMPGAAELVGTMRADGAYCVLVSGGFDYFTSRVARALGFHEDRANRLETRDGRLTGRVLEPILDKDAKLASLMEVSASRGIRLSDTLAAGDGANDLPMLLAAGLGVAYHAKPAVREAAQARICHTDLKALLYAQGYPRRAFATS